MEQLFIIEKLRKMKGDIYNLVNGVYYSSYGNTSYYYIFRKWGKLREYQFEAKLLYNFNY